MADRSGYIGRAPGDSSVTVARQTFSPTGITTDFTFESGYTPGYFDIFINGAKMIEGSDYTSTDGSTFVILNGGVISGDVIEGVAYKAFNAATATIGISSAGTPISTQANTLNFVGTGNTFALRGSTIDVSISVGAGGTWSNYDSNAGVTTTKKVKIQNNLEVTGVSTFSGFVAFSTSISVGGTVTYEDVTNIDSIGIITARSGVSIGDSIFHTGNTNTAIRFPVADTFTVETAGSERVRVTGIGSIGINETTPDSKVDIVHSTSTNTATENLIHLRTDPSGSYASRGLFVKIGRDGGYDNSGAHYDIVGSAGNSGFHVFEVQGSEKLRIDSSGRTTAGGESATASGPQYSRLQVLGNSYAETTGLFSLRRNEVFGDITAGEDLGVIHFADRTGNTFAEIHGTCDGTTGSSDYPGRLTFYTTADGASSTTERLRITSDGKVGINQISPSHKLQVEDGSSGVIVAKQTTNNGGYNIFEGDASDGTTKFYVSHNGRVGAADGIIFGSDTAADNILDDYEEGTWTPSIGGNASYTTQTGTYTKVGRLVYVNCNIQINVIGTGSVTTITGLPFSSSGGLTDSSAVGYWTSGSRNVTTLMACTNATQIVFTDTASAASGTNLNGGIFQNSTNLRFGLCYQV